jgi:hypothetical protein
LIDKNYEAFKDDLQSEFEVLVFLFLHRGSLCNTLSNTAIFLCHFNEILVGGIFWIIKVYNPSESFIPPISLLIPDSLITLISQAINFVF